VSCIPANEKREINCKMDEGFSPYSRRCASELRLSHLNVVKKISQCFSKVNFKRLCKLRILTVALFVSLLQSAWKNLAPTERIFMVFDIADLFAKMTVQFGFYWKPTNRTPILREDISTFTRIILGLIKFQVTFVEKIKINISYE